MKFIVQTSDMRAALQAVVPHVEPDKELAHLHRVRIDVADDVTVSATNGYTAAVGLVSVWEHGDDGEVGSFDLSPRDVKEILVLFRGGKAGEDLPDETLQFEVDDKHLTVTDWGGLFPGKQLQLPRYPEEENYPDIERLIGLALTRETLGADRIVTSAKLLGLFLKAAAAYGRPLVMDVAGDRGSLLVSCGESFLGLLRPSALNDEETAEMAEWHKAWLRRIAARVPTGASS